MKHKRKNSKYLHYVRFYLTDTINNKKYDSPSRSVSVVTIQQNIKIKIAFIWGFPKFPDYTKKNAQS